MNAHEKLKAKKIRLTLSYEQAECLQYLTSFGLSRISMTVDEVTRAMKINDILKERLGK